MNDITANGRTGADSHPDLETAFRDMHSILQKESFRSISKLLCETAGKTLGAGASYAVIINPAGGKPEISVWDHFTQKYTLNSVLPPAIAALCANKTGTDKPSYQNDLSAQPPGQAPGTGYTAPARNLMTIPLCMDGCSLGFIGLTDKPGGFTEEDVVKADYISRLASIAIARNISLEMLSSREKQYRYLFEHAGEPIVVNDMRGVFLDVNRKACETLGYSKGELLGKNVRDIIPSNDAARIGILLKKTRAKNDIVFETGCLRKDGSSVEMEVSSRIFNYYGHEAVLTLAQDISARKRAADSLALDKNRLESLWHIYKHQTEGVKELLDYVLEEALKLTGSRAGRICRYYYDAQEKSFLLESWGKELDNNVCILAGPPAPAPRKTGLWGKALSRRKPIILRGPEGSAESAADFLAEATQDLKCLIVPGFVSEDNAAVIGLRLKKGDYTDSDARQVTLLVDSVLELVRRKKNQEELAKNRVILNAIMNSTPDAIAAKDISGRYTAINPRAAAFMHRSVEAVVGKRDADLFAPGKAGKIHEKEKKLLADKKIETFEEEAGTGDKKRTMLVTKGPLFDETGRLMGLFSMSRDITERKKMEMELINVQKAESLGVMAAGIAHDFNNMLTAILGNTSLALETLPSKGQLFRLLNNTLKAGRSAQELTHQLQTFARGEESVPKHVLDLRRVIKEAARLAGSGAKTKFLFDFNADTPQVQGNEGQLKQVINNLALNATQAMSLGGTLTIKTAAVNIQERIAPNLGPGAYVRITVADTGPGIREKDIGKIFDPYFSTKKKGRGLGLSMVYSIIKKHGGHIGVVSKEGEGTMFLIYLPAVKVRGAKEKHAKRPVKGGKGRILVMDDDKLVLDVLTLILQRLGYTTQTAEDGWAAIAAYTRAARDKEPFSAVIMDLTIPGSMGGDEAAKRLKAIDPKVKLVLSSGYANSTVMANCAEHSFDTILPKPYHTEEVGEIMAKLLKPAKKNPAGRRTALDA